MISPRVGSTWPPFYLVEDLVTYLAPMLETLEIVPMTISVFLIDLRIIPQKRDTVDSVPSIVKEET